MSKNYGWISLNRKLTSNWLWQDKPFSKGQAWIDLLLHANHTDSKILIKESLVILKRGEQARSQVTLSQSWGWSRDKVRRYLKMLEEDGMIIQQTSQLTSVISICNYNDYQDTSSSSNTADNTSDDTAGNTTDQQQTDSRQDTVNNNNNGNNENNGKQKPIPYSAIAELYNSCFALPSGNASVRANELSDKRKRAIKKLWNLGEDKKNLDWWKNYFTFCANQPNLQFGAPRAKGWENWNPNFDFIVRQDTLDKQRESK